MRAGDAESVIAPHMVATTIDATMGSSAEYIIPCLEVGDEGTGGESLGLGIDRGGEEIVFLPSLPE